MEGGKDCGPGSPSPAHPGQRPPDLASLPQKGKGSRGALELQRQTAVLARTDDYMPLPVPASWQAEADQAVSPSCLTYTSLNKYLLIH